MKQVFTAINGILIVKLERIDTKIQLLPLKMQKLQPKSVYSHSYSCNCLGGPLGINFFQKLFC